MVITKRAILNNVASVVGSILQPLIAGIFILSELGKESETVVYGRLNISLAKF